VSASDLRIHLSVDALDLNAVLTEAVASIPVPRRSAPRWAAYLAALIGLLAGLALSGCASAPYRPAAASAPARKLEAKLVLSRQIGFAPLEIVVRILVLDPAHEMSCPRYFWDCGNGQPPSTVESDCDPGTVADIHGEQRTCFYGLPGDYEVRGIVTDGTHGPGRASRELAAWAPVILAEQEPPDPSVIIAYAGHEEL
jgi:hypothetical protein